MAIHESTVIESNTGYAKTIDAASMHMALDVLQKYQYQYPQKSTVRELAANAVDSIKERDIAKLILTGEAKEEDYYIRRDNAEFKDSNFNAAYFDLDWLSDKKEVEIIYEEGDGIVKKDKLRVVDYGVGLGSNRLELYFKLNASTKRNSKTAIGKWGLGNKTPLSTGIDSFRMTSYYNGKRYSFDIYSHKIDSVTDKFNAAGEINPTEQFSNGYTFYYEVTTEKNHTEISFETKKHHRSQYTEAVRQQLLYFDNIVYTVVQESGYKNQIATKANVIYEDDDIILSDNNQYSKPHSVIGNVSYGYIQFLELELEDKQGNIGIKLNAEDVDISPSRENILWTDKTRKSVTDKFAKVVEIASKEVEKQLTENDFVKWLEKCSRVMSHNDSYSILGRLSRVIDKGAIKPTYAPDKTIKYKSPRELLYGVSLREVYIQQNYGRNVKITMVRDDLASWNSLQNYKIYYTKSTANNLKDRYITHTQSGRFILLQIPEMRDETAFKEGAVALALTSLSSIISIEDQWKEYKDKYDAQAKVINLIIASVESIDYDALVVPDDFKTKLEESEKVEEDGTVTGIPVPELTPTEKRKLDERTVLYYPEKSSYDRNTNKVMPQGPTSTFNQTYNTRHIWIKHEPKISEVLAWEGTIVYAFGDEDELLLTAAWIIEQQTGSGFFTDSVKLVRVSKSIKKYFKGHTHITEFFKQVNGTELNMNNLFVNWYTGKRIADGLAGFEFLNNFSMFNQEMFDKYHELKTYSTGHYKSLAPEYHRGNMLGCTKEAFDAILQYADSMAEAQIKDLQTEYTSVTAIDMAKYDLLQEVIEYATPLKGILNYIQPLINATATTGAGINFELESEIKEIMRNKGYDS